MLRIKRKFQPKKAQIRISKFVMSTKSRKKQKRLGEKLLCLRKQLDGGIPQHEMIRRLGVEGDIDRSFLSKYENNLSEPSLYLLCLYADLFSISLDNLIRDELDLPPNLENEKDIKPQNPHIKEQEFAYLKKRKTKFEISEKLEENARAIIKPLERVWITDFETSEEYQAIFTEFVNFMNNLPLEEKRHLYLKTLLLFDGIEYWRYEKLDIKTVGQLLDTGERQRIIPGDYISLPSVEQIGFKRNEIIIKRLESIGLKTPNDFKI